ncbi:MAG: triple tyrosine motif-containing protein, partial [Flavobacteriales bacterium]
FLDKDAKGKTTFVSLKDLAPKPYNHPNIIFHIAYYHQKVYFSSSNCIYVYDGKTVEIILPEETPRGELSEFGFVGVVDDELFVYNDHRGLGKIMEGKYQPLFMKRQLADTSAVVGVVKKSDNSYLIIQKDGFSTIEDGQLLKRKMNMIATDAELLNNNTVAVSTELNGILIFDFEGNVLEVLDKKIGLKNNFVNEIYKDSKGSLWASLNNGIALIKWNSPFSYINEIQGVEGMGYSSVLLNDTLYLGTSQGMYYAAGWNKNKNRVFQKVNGIGLIINDMKVMNGKLICSDESDVYEVNGIKAKKISKAKYYGGWTFKKIPGIDSLLICGTYADLSVYAFRKGHWVFRNAIAGFGESCRMFEIDDRGVLWLVQGVAALYRIELNSEYTKATKVENYADKYHFYAGYFNDIVKVNHELKVSSDGGIYIINEKDELVKDQEFSFFPNTIKRLRMVEGSVNELYIILNERPAFIELRQGKYVISAVASANVKDKLVGSAEYVGKISNSEYLIATQLGFALFDPSKSAGVKGPKCLIRQVKLLNTDNDSTLLMGLNKTLSYTYKQNSLAFSFALPVYGVNSKIIYHTELSSSNHSFVWKDESTNSFKEYTNLPEGEYTFKVQAELNGKMFDAGVLAFTILPPWYRTIWAYLFYILFTVLVVVLIRRKVQQRFKVQREKMELEKIKEIQNQEAMHKTEILEVELQRKNDEMAFLALTFTQKKQFLSFLKTQLTNISKNMKDEASNSELKSLIRSIGVEDKEAENWEKFQMHFDKTNDNFFQKLKQLDPKMNESTLLMCSYIRMNKSNKEIADLLSISISGVEKRKYRLKEKLGIKEEGSITDFISKL